jgi:hypothetical protein
MAPELAPYEGTVTAPTPSIVEIEAWVAEVTGAPFSFPGELDSYPRLSSRQATDLVSSLASLVCFPLTSPTVLTLFLLCRWE